MRSLLRVGIRPLKNSRISFGVQLAIVFFWLAYASALLLTESEANDRSYLHLIFLVLALLYLIYILAQNTSIFGTQSYLEITPAYIVQKNGHFRPKQVIAFEEISSVQFSPTVMRFKLKNGQNETMDLKSLKSRKNVELVKEKMQLMAERHRFEFSIIATK